MRDPRVEKLAHVVVRYSVAVSEGQLVLITGSPATAPLIRELYREVVLAGGHPLVRMEPEETAEILLKHGSESQIRYVSPIAQLENERIDALIGIFGEENTKRLSGIDPARIAWRRQAGRAMQEHLFERAAAGEARWSATLFPTPAGAQDADMSLADYEDFVYGAGKLAAEDPVAEWRAVQERQQRYADFLAARRVIHIVAPDTDLTYDTGGRSWINACGHENFPDGEVFTSPDEAQTQGHVRFTYPAVYAGREVQDVRLVFRDGAVAEATAAKGQDLLDSLLGMDEGARRLGEAAFGLNYDIRRFTRHTLFDEKIGGTIHLALGQSFPEIGGRNASGLHWDMVCDLREGGEVYADGELIYRAGRFLI
jgi:aminopeptidase